MDRWSGPGLALDTHLREWADCDRVLREVDAALAHGELAVTPASPYRLRLWLGFARTYAFNQFNYNDDGASNGAIEPPSDWPPRYPSADAAARATDRQEERQRIGAGTLGFLRGEHDALSGPTFYVSESVVDTVTYIASQAEPEPLFPTDLITPAGFAVFEHPWIVPDLHPDTGEVCHDLLLPVRAVAWHATTVGDPDEGGKPGDGVSVTWYCDIESWREVYAPSYEAVMGAVATSGLDGSHWRPGYLMPIEVNPWKFGRSWSVDPDPQGWLAGKQNENAGTQRRWFFAWQRLMWQRLIRTEPIRPHRAAARRLLRANFPGDGYVRVLHYRRYDTPPGREDEAMEPGFTLNRRVRVRGHWRRVHVKSLGAARLPDGSMDPATHRLTWIDEHWRGPEEGPMFDGHDVYGVVR